MNILSIYPEFPDTFWSFKHSLPFIGKKAALPPLGLVTLGAMLPENGAAPCANQRTMIPLDFQRFLAFFRSNIRLGVFGKERFQYWGLLLWTLFLRPELLPLAITFAIHGHHFRRICEQYIL